MPGSLRPVVLACTGQASALQPFKSFRQRLVAHGLLKWTAGFQLQAAVRTDETVSAMLPIVGQHSAQVQFLAVGDAGGAVYLFNAEGILQHEVRTGK